MNREESVTATARARLRWPGNRSLAGHGDAFFSAADA